VQAGRVRRTDVDPDAQPAGEIANRDRRFIRIVETARELDPLRELERVRQHPRHQVLLGFGRVPGNAQRQRLVHAAVGVGQVDVQVVDGRVQCHGS
jgi:hypothetical protein